MNDWGLLLRLVGQAECVAVHQLALLRKAFTSAAL